MGHKQSQILGLALLFAVIGGAPGWAENEIEEVVVTGARAYESEAPSVVLVKRADHLITKVRLSCDTRDASQRRDEMKATLRAMIAEAKRSASISLGVGDSVLNELIESNFDDILTSDTRPDTSAAEIVVKTAITKDDTFDGATARIKDFVAKSERVGRTEIVREPRWDLTLIGPDQYHDELVARIAEQSKKTAAQFGANYGVTIDGLEHAVAWHQKGPLDLALYIPYSFHVTPLNSH